MRQRQERRINAMGGLLTPKAIRIAATIARAFPALQWGLFNKGVQSMTYRNTTALDISFTHDQIVAYGIMPAVDENFDSKMHDIARETGMYYVYNPTVPPIGTETTEEEEIYV